MQQLAKKFISSGEYFAMEEAAEYKNEYYQGEIFAMSGASFNHNVISGNTFAMLHYLLGDSDCIVFGSDMKIEVDKESHYTYPDVSIVCGEIEFVENRNDIITNPLVIFEILSESTKDYDRGSKFTAYRNIASLKDYILIDQYTCHVEYFYKNNMEQWTLREFKHMDDVFKVHSVAVELSLKKIYNRVKW
jgi:Uma2 family endonuclease